VNFVLYDLYTVKVALRVSLLTTIISSPSMKFSRSYFIGVPIYESGVCSVAKAYKLSSLEINLGRYTIINRLRRYSNVIFNLYTFSIRGRSSKGKDLSRGLLL
jgi:phosphatidylserine synthase